jgi:hypothetical protein
MIPSRRKGSNALRRIEANVLLAQGVVNNEVTNRLGLDLVSSIFDSLYEPRNYDIVKYQWIRPDPHLPSQMPALRVDPSGLGHVSLAEKQIEVRNRYLCVEHTADH